MTSENPWSPWSRDAGSGSGQTAPGTGGPAGPTPGSGEGDRNAAAGPPDPAGSGASGGRPWWDTPWTAEQPAEANPPAATPDPDPGPPANPGPAPNPTQPLNPTQPELPASAAAPSPWSGQSQPGQSQPPSPWSAQSPAPSPAAGGPPPWGPSYPGGPGGYGPTGPTGPTGPGGYGSGGSGGSGRGNRRIAAGAVALVLASAGVGGLVGAAVGGHGTTTVVSGAGLTQSRDNTASAISPAAAGTVAAAARVILPSVVTISEESSQESGTGSGVIIRSDGYILTNNHVVSAAADGGSLTVTLQNGKTYTASIKGRDPSSDLAVVKINATGLTVATIGNSNALGVGDLVVAVGSPLGLAGTVTSGIVSALHRPVRTGDSAVTDTDAVLDAIQTDAPINPGNSGGALVNSKGELVGINSAIATVGGSGGFGGQTQQSGNIGVGFAIPATYAATVASQLINTGTATHPYLGVQAPVDSTNSASPTDGNGATIPQLVKGGPAEKAGLHVGDVITGVGGRQITSFDSLVAAIRSHAIGDRVTITYTRGGSSHTVTVTLAQQPAS